MKISKLYFIVIVFLPALALESFSVVGSPGQLDFIPAQFSLPEDVPQSRDISGCRDPFTPKKVTKNISLISVLSDESKKMAIVEYDNESILVSIGDTIGSKWQVISIEDKEIVLESAKTKKKKTVVLNDD